MLVVVLEGWSRGRTSRRREEVDQEERRGCSRDAKKKAEDDGERVSGRGGERKREAAVGRGRENIGVGREGRESKTAAAG